MKNKYSIWCRECQHKNFSDDWVENCIKCESKLVNVCELSIPKTSFLPEKNFKKGKRCLTK